MRRVSECKNCDAPIFLPIGKGWVHVEPRVYACSVQQAINYRPQAEPK